MNFEKWLESNNNIFIISYDRTGRITFNVNGQEETYVTDAGYFVRYKSIMKTDPEEAYRDIKAQGTLLEPRKSNSFDRRDLKQQEFDF